MKTADLIEALADPAAYPHHVENVEIRQTHISVVFLAGPYVYKIKKSVNFGFLDFSTLAKRRHFCDEEIRLNRRLAPGVYLKVVPVARVGDGLRLEGTGKVVEWAVKMQRLPEEATLEHRLQYDDLSAGQVETLARKLAAFHGQSPASAHIADCGRFDVVAGNIRAVLEQSEKQVGSTLSSEVYQRLHALLEESLQRCRSLIDHRAKRGVPRDTHGDLRLEHIYLLPDRPLPANLVIVDCIEFNERLRFTDPVADMAFLAMDLTFHGRQDLAQTFVDAYFQASADDEGRALLPLYSAYRAAVRGKVEGLKALEIEVPDAQREAASAKARAYWLLALAILEKPSRKPCLVLIGGLPGSGKSTLAQQLAEQADFHVIRSDVVRKELWSRATTGVSESTYSTAWTERTYMECLSQVQTLLFAGKRVIVDATFREEYRRQAFLKTANRCGVPGIFLLCQTDPEVVRKRLLQRRGDASDADWSIYLQMAADWEDLGDLSQKALRIISADGDKDQTFTFALEALRQFHLQD